MHDGPGVRTTVFLKGCPLRCAWCHNPETQKMSTEMLFYANKCLGCGSCVTSCPMGVHSLNDKHCMERQKCIACAICASQCPTGALEACGTDMSVEQILAVVKKDCAFYGETGGITLSGGEPFAQKEATISLLKACKEHSLTTAVESCGYVDTDILRAAIPFVDLFLWDIKDTNDQRHQQFTGVSNRLILKNLQMANEMQARIRLRCILVNGINTDVTHYKKLAEIAKSIHNFDGLEIIPYHAYGGAKAVFIGHEDNGKAEWIPTEEQIQDAKKHLGGYV